MEELNKEEQKQIDSLSLSVIAEIEEVLIKNSSSQWRKIARVVAETMMELEPKYKDFSDLFYGQMVVNLIKKGKLVSQGDIYQMRFSEVKLP